MTGTSRDQLPCGAPVDDLIAQVADGHATRRTTHQRNCPHCQAALTEYDHIWGPVTALAAEQVQAPDSLIDEILRRIRITLEHPEYGLLPGPDGLTRIAVRVIIITARAAAERTDGVRAALTHAQPTDSTATVAAGVTGSSTALQITVAATYGHDLPALADRIRRAVAHDIHTYTGLRPADLTVVIDDILQP